MYTVPTNLRSCLAAPIMTRIGGTLFYGLPSQLTILLRDHNLLLDTAVSVVTYTKKLLTEHILFTQNIHIHLHFQITTSTIKLLDICENHPGLN